MGGIDHLNDRHAKEITQGQDTRTISDRQTSRHADRQRRHKDNPKQTGRHADRQRKTQRQYETDRQRNAVSIEVINVCVYTVLCIQCFMYTMHINLGS